MQRKSIAMPGAAERRSFPALKRYIQHRYYFLMLLPVLAYFLVFHYAPIYGVLMAFQDYRVFKGISGSEFVGLKHFRELFDGLYFLPVLKNTLIINAYKIVFGFPAPIILALLINEVMRPRFKKWVQTISYLPHFLSWIVLSGIIIEMLSPSRGALNVLLMELGFQPVYFLASTDWFRSVLVSTEIWKGVGFSAIIYLAAIAGISPELYEAAEVDGISRLKKVWYITLPSIAPVIVIMIILNSGSIINDDFDQIYNLLNTNVLSVGDVISTYTYTEGIAKMNYSYAAAVGLFKNAIALVMVLTANTIARRFSDQAIF
ncbi:ABC transporter permease subunit [Saccharibacillus sp. CPCC 101409]|uniref:ABC transporter permease n=1 Tax=Saccharibacillus sp. CPCC 101409 TaxID=3058041 RepID=UPI002671D68A|nr:ABC transporter permease subunit [Saccharibacillus sp. CPCC 101409]MDO3412485.1 ABC transporter permease subunit [Saccharibacillus sp. CPCC 101409]